MPTSELIRNIAYLTFEIMPTSELIRTIAYLTFELMPRSELIRTIAYLTFELMPRSEIRSKANIKFELMQAPRSTCCLGIQELFLLGTFPRNQGRRQDFSSRGGQINYQGGHEFTSRRLA